MDTIFALASARGKAGVAVIRISGPRAWDAASALGGPLPEVRRASVRKLEWNGEPLDEGLVLTFADGASFTGELAVELHIHGAVATIEAVLRALGGMSGLRMAEPGEFTRRALENGRFDLSQVEGLADLIDAETEAQRKQALKVLSGDVSRQAEAWRRDLIRAAALLEATIDFADEDVPVDVGPEVLRLVEGVVAELRQAITGYGAAERIRQGFEVAIVGRPNAGKSTLLNALAGREAAITSETAGTTRDVIEVRMDVDGLAVTFLDTAGLRVTEDDVERIGVRRAIDRAAAADLRIFLLDREGEVPLVSAREGDIVTLGKADLNQGSASGRLSVSGKTGAGIGELIRRVSEMLGSRSASAGIITRERQRQAVSAAISSMESACDAVRAGPSRTEIAAELLRRGVRALDSLVGRVDVEDLLDDIFARFCIGK